MPLGARDVFIVLHARDQATRTIRTVGASFGTLNTQAQTAAAQTMAAGSALVGLGAGMAFLGGFGVRTMLNMASAAMEYNNQAAMTLTQVQGTGTGLEEIKRIGRDVALAIPAPFEEMQGGLYDIFSSMDVNVRQAETMLTGFAKAAVAGQVPIQTAGRATIAVMNAWGIPVDDLNHVLDVQFELVRSGVGTYDEFASSIGRAIPSARRAGQDFETLAGVMAFLTRNGLSAEMAATSSARAFDTLANPKVIERLADMGVAVLDNNGNFRQMNDIVRDLVEGPLADLSDAERAEVINSILGGAGNTAQARRFWDLAIRGYEQLDELVGRMINSSGALEDAYEIMLEDPQVMMQALQNQWEVLQTELGDAVVPMLLMAAGGLSKILSFFNALDPSTKAWIARIILLGSVLLIALGIITAFAGVLLILSATAAMMGTSLLALTGWALLFVAALAGAAYLIITNWDTIMAWWTEFWPRFKDRAQRIWDAMFEGWDALWVEIKDLASDVWQWLQERWDELWPRLKDAASAVWQSLQEIWDSTWNGIKDKFGTFWTWLQETAVWQWLEDEAQPVLTWFQETFMVWWTDTFLPRMQEIWNWMKTNVPAAWDEIEKAAMWVYEQVFVPFYEWLRDEFWPGMITIWESIQENVIPILVGLGVMVVIILTAIKIAWETFHSDAFSIASLGWMAIVLNITGWLQSLRGVFQTLEGIIETDWDTFWQGIRNLAIGAFKGTLAMILLLMLPFIGTFLIGITVIRIVWGKLWEWVPKILEWAKDRVLDAWDGMWRGLTTVGKVLGTGLSILWSTLWTGMTQTFTLFWTGISLLWTTLWNGLRSTFTVVAGFISTIWNGLLNGMRTAWNLFSGPLLSVWTVLWGTLRGIFGPIVSSIASAWNSLLTGIVTALSITAPVFRTAMNIFMLPLAGLKWLIDTIWATAKQVVEWFQSAFNFHLDLSGLLGPLGALAGVLGTVYRGLQNVANLIPGVSRGSAGGVNLGGGSTATRVGGVGGVGSFPSRIKASASGTNSLRGWSWVGEDGLELMNTGPGGITRIIPNAMSKTMLERAGGIGGGSTVVVLQVQGPIQDRNDLVYRAGRELEWHDYTRGK